MDRHFFILICCKNCNDVCLKRLKIKKEAGVGPFFKKISDGQWQQGEGCTRFCELWPIMLQTGQSRLSILPNEEKTDKNLPNTYKLLPKG